MVNTTRRQTLVGTAVLVGVAGCLGDSDDDSNGDNDDASDSDPVAEFEAPEGDGFPAHSTLEDGVTEIKTRSQFLEILESNGLEVDDWSHQPGTLMGLHIVIDEEPSALEDVAAELNLISKAWAGWMLFEGEVKPGNEWSPDDMESGAEDDERYPANLIEINFYTDASGDRVGWVELEESALIGYFTGETSAEEYRSTTADGAAVPA